MHKGHVHKVLQQRMQDAHPCSGNLLDAIKRDFGSMEQLQSKLSAESAAVQVRVHGVIDLGRQDGHAYGYTKLGLVGSIRASSSG